MSNETTYEHLRDGVSKATKRRIKGCETASRFDREMLHP